MKRFYLLMMLLVVAAANALAQGKYDVKGIVIDHDNGDAMLGATVQLLSLPDSAFVAGSVANDEGKFTFGNLTKKKYTVKITSVGYVTKCVDLTIDNKSSRHTDLGYITLTSDARMLKEVTITSNVSKMQVSGDSLVYNASAYPVPEGSTLEALVKLLPGAEVDEDGNITINGKTVNKILVDGKEFFLNDKNVAMKNIPIDIIDKVKSYERKSDMARVTGIDDGEEETVLDLSVKKGMKNGWFGNVNGAAGTEHRYDSRTMVNHFNDNMQVSVLANGKNTPNRWGWGNNGLRSTKEVGANFATTSTKLETGGSVRYNYDGSDAMSSSSSENFVAEVGKFNKSSNQNISSNGYLNANFRIEWKPDTMTNIIFRPNLSYSRNRGMGFSNSGSYNDELMTDAVNTNKNNSQSYSTNFNVNGELQVNRRLNSAGRNITFRSTGSYSDGTSKQLSAAHIDYNGAKPEQMNNRYYYTPSTSHNISAMLSYSEPIADRTYLQLSYRYQYGYNKNDRQAYIYDSDAYHELSSRLELDRYDIDAVLDYMAKTAFNRDISDNLSQFSEYRNYNQRISLQVRRVRPEYNMSIGVDAMPQRTKLNYKYMGVEYPEITREVFNFAPRAFIRWNFDKNNNLQFRYNGRSTQPSMTNLLDITDDSNPLNISKGNPDLKPSFSHNFEGRFQGYNPETQCGEWIWTNGAITNNSIANKTTYDEYGVRTTKPMNINGNWNIGIGGGGNIGLGNKKLFSVGMDGMLRYNHNVGFYNNTNGGGGVDNQDIKSITKNSTVGGGLRGSYRTETFSAELRGNLRYSHIKNNMNMSANQNTYNYSYGGNVQWRLPWGMELATDMFMNSRRGYSVSEMNTNELLWNASIAQSFLKGNALTLKAEIFDILGEQTNISRTVNAFMRSDSRSNAIYQYAMFSAIFRFSVFAGKNTMGTDQEKRNDNQRRRW